MFDHDLVVVASQGRHRRMGVRFDALTFERPIELGGDGGVGVRHDSGTGFEQADAGESRKRADVAVREGQLASRDSRRPDLTGMTGPWSTVAMGYGCL